MFRKAIQFPILTALFAIVFISCQVNTPVDESKINEVNEQFMAAFKTGDAEAVTALYTGDAIVLAPNSEALNTTEDINDLWSGMMDLGVSDVELVTNEIIPAGDMAVETGEYTVFAGDLEIDHGKYMVLWKNENGQWKLHRDIWNSSMPMLPTEEDSE